ncbi:MAG: type II toxin-antitoxin system VapC family toxin [Candidatus Dormibacteraeota bacterium]|uniref:Ribonuclease VapC n=1 Tax=Candidatus Amunia macphersoniae TaxID=3127014 RepID=A0A934KJX6_9BACT|nr:type II toxin-antitoxin system VapC family toxin [Candidatus Dormibacteraeota bacterium]
MSGDVAYLDTSAVVKLLVEEEESAALRRALRRWPRRASSSLLRVELVRTVRRADRAPLMARVRRQLRAIHLVGLDDDTLDRAAALDPPSLRSLDAIHLATAMAIGADLGVFVTYDERLRQAADALALVTAAPS